MKNNNFNISSLGRYLPVKSVSSEEIDLISKIPLGSTKQKTFINYRYWAQAHETTLFMAKQAVDDALRKANLRIDDIDCVINAGCLVPQMIPSTSSLLLAQYKTSKQDCFDIDCTCLSFLRAMDIAINLLQTNRYRRILIFSSELASYGINKDNQNTFGLFGDGAIALILDNDQKAHQSRLHAVCFETYPEASQHAQYRGCGTLTHPKSNNPIPENNFSFEMNGPKLFRTAYKEFPEFLKRLLERSEISKEDIKYFIPHQASYQSMVLIQKALALEDLEMINIISEHGNQVSASLPNALYSLVDSGGLKTGDKVLFLGAAAGMVLGGMILEY